MFRSIIMRSERVISYERTNNNLIDSHFCFVIVALSCNVTHCHNSAERLINYTALTPTYCRHWSLWKIVSKGWFKTKRTTFHRNWGIAINAEHTIVSLRIGITRYPLITNFIFLFEFRVSYWTHFGILCFEEKTSVPYLIDTKTKI